jgi:hypothetical protein
MSPVVFTVSLVAFSGLTPQAGASGPGEGYLLVGSDGGAFAYGNVGYYGSMSGQTLNMPIVGAAVTANGGGYVEAGGDGGVFIFGNAPNDGSIYQFGRGSSQSWFKGNIVGVALTADNGGYWLVADNGWVCGFGDAPVYAPNHQLHGTNGCWSGPGSHYVAIAADPANSAGYWLVTANGQVYAYGAAPYYGNAGISNGVAITPTPDGNGYWIAGSDGGVFALGDANFYGSYGGTSTTNTVGIFGTPDGGGYWLARSTGAVLTFGDAAFLGSMEFQYLAGPIVGIA